MTIKEIIIIFNGLPIYSQGLITGDFSTESGNIFSKRNDLILASGFFSALNSFSDQFEDLGAIRELKLSKTDLTLSFIKDKSIPNLIYLASFDEKSNGVNVQRFLRKISRTFLQKYNIDQINKWSGRLDSFKNFEEHIEKFVEEEKQEEDAQFKEKIVDLFKEVEEKINDNNPQSQIEMDSEVGNQDNKSNDNKLNVNDRIPFLKISKDLNPKYYLSGEISFKVFELIDSKKSISDIAELLKIDEARVYNICKNLVKLGFISIYSSTSSGSTET